MRFYFCVLILTSVDKIDQNRKHFWVIGLENNNRILFIELIIPKVSCMVASISFSIMVSTGFRSLSPVSSLYAHTWSPCCMSSIFLCPSFIAILVPAVKQRNPYRVYRFLCFNNS